MVFKILNIIISLVFFIYYIFLQKYLLNIFCCKKTTKFSLVYWIDYIINILSLTIISLMFTSNFYINKDNEKKILDNNFFTIIFDDYFPLFFLSNFIMNIIISFQIIVKIKKMKISQNEKYDISKMNKFINKINIMSHYTLIRHMIYLFIIYLLDILIILIDKYKQKEYKYIIKVFQISLWIVTLIIMLIISNQNKSLIGHQIFFKNNIVEKIYNNNKIKLITSSEHLLYKYICDLLLNIPSFIKIFFNQDSESYKVNYFYSTMFAGFLYLYFFGIMLLSVDSTNFKVLPCILKFLFCAKKYNFYFGDGKKLITKIFEPDNTNIYNYNNYFNNLKQFTNEEDYINKLNGLSDYSGGQSSLNSMVGKSDLKSINTKGQNINLTKTQSELIDEKIKELEYEKIKKEKEFSPCNFFIIFKLMYLYFNFNIKVYQNIKKSTEENGFFNEINNNKNKITRKTIGRISNINNIANSSEKRLSLAHMKEKMSRISKVEFDQLSSFKKYNLKEVMGNIQEYNMKTFFINYLSKNLNKNDNNKTNNKSNIINNNKDNELNIINIKDNEIELNNKFYLPPEVLKDKTTIFIQNDLSNSNINRNSISSLLYDNNIDNDKCEFKIESLMNSILLDLFPFYEIDIKDIINSLNTSNNMNLFHNFFKKKYDDKNFNSYYTSDYFLNFEIYDDKFLSYEQLQSFMNNYEKYFMEKISNFSYTFLPLIIGIFNINYLSYNKTIILYRHPLAFTPNVSFHYWLNFLFCSDFDKMETSTNTNDIVDINEIEVINNIKLNNEEYLDTLNILDDDLNFLMSMNFNLDFKLNLFILNDVNNQNLEDSIFNKDNSKLHERESNNNKNSLVENNNLMNMIRNTELFPGNNMFEPFNYNFKKKFFGSELISLLENLYISDLADNNYIFKIYFGEIFKKKNFNKKGNNKNKINIINEDRNSLNISLNNISDSMKENEIKENNANLCKFLKNKLLRKIGKSKDDFFEEENLNNSNK